MKQLFGSQGSIILVLAVVLVALLYMRWWYKFHCAICRSPAKTYRQEHFETSSLLVRDHSYADCPCPGSHRSPIYSNQQRVKAWLDRIREFHNQLSGWK